MDSIKTSAPEMVSHHQSGTYSSPLSYDSNNSNNSYDNSLKNLVIEGEGNSKINGNGGVSDGESENGEFLSGEEGFDTASEKPVVAEETLEKPTDEGFIGASCVDSSEFSLPVRVLPIQKVVENDNDDNDVVGDSEIGILKEEGEVKDLVGDGGDKGLKMILDEGFVKQLEIEGVCSGNEGLREDENSSGFVSEKQKGVEEQKSEVFDGAESGETKENEGKRRKTESKSDFEAKQTLVDLEGTADVVENGSGAKVDEGVGDETQADDSVDKAMQNEAAHEDENLGNEQTVVGAHIQKLEDKESGKSHAPETAEMSEISNAEVTLEAEEEGNRHQDEEDEIEGLASDGDTDGMVFGSSEAAKQFLEELEQASGVGSLSGPESSRYHSQRIDGQIVTDSDEEVATDEEGEGKELFDTLEAEEEGNHHQDEDEIEGLASDGDTDGMVFGSSEAAKQFLEELEHASGVGSQSGAESSRYHSQRIDGQIVRDSDEEVATDEEGEGRELFDSAALGALLKAAAGADSDGGNITITSQGGSKFFSVEPPAGLGTSLRTLKPAPRPNRTNLFTHSSHTTGGETETNLSEEEKTKLEKLQQLRVKFLRLVHRLGHFPDDSTVGQVLYRLALVAGRQTGQLFNLDCAKRTALHLETEGKNDLDFYLNILVLGKTGVGKSATINSIFGEEKSVIHAFEPGTTSVKEIVGTVDGVKIRVIDTPGLKSSGVEQGANRKVLASIKKFTREFSPDIVLYVDRLDSRTRDLNDLPLLRSITNAFGASIWHSAIVTLTHAASAPPDGPSGSPLSYEAFVAQSSQVIQHSIGQAVGDMRMMNPSLMNPVSLVENHPACRRNRDGQKVLPNGQTWRPQLLLLCCSMKILSEASSPSKPQESFDHRKLFGFRVRSPPLPYLLSWLLQSRTHPKLSTDQVGDNGDSDIDLADLPDSDHEEDEDEYDQLPAFKPLRKAQIAKLSKEQRKAYFEEYDYRVKLLQKKQWREEIRRMRDVKKKGKTASEDYGFEGEDVDQENGSPAAVPVPLPDMILPPSFDGAYPAYRYRFLEPNSQFLARPVLDTHGWDHDCGYDGVNLERSLAVASRFPAAVTVQVTKDKKEFNLHLDSSIAAKLGENVSSMAGFDIQNVGKQLAYVFRGETKFKNFKRNKTAVGVSVTFLGESVATGFKLEDQIALGKRLMLVGGTGTVRSQSDSAYGANLEVRLRDADFPIGQDQSSLGLSLVKWRGDLALGANLQSQFSIGRSSTLAVRAGLNNKRSGQITIRTSTSDQLQIALLGILPVVMTIYKSIRPEVENY